MSKQREQINVRPDMSTISDDSALLQQDTRSKRQILSDMNGKEKASFIAEYYGRKIVLGTVGIAIVIFLMVHFLFQKDTALSIIAVNTTTIGKTAADEPEFYSGVLASCGIEPDSVRVSVDSGFGVSPDPDDNVSQSNIQGIQTRLMAGSVDVLFSDEDFLYSLGEFDYMMDLRMCLPADVLKTYADELVYTKSIETGETYPVGIRLPENPWIADTGWYENQEVVVGIAEGAPNPKVAETLVLTVLGETE
ncbi:MAG: hypothetical protein ACI4F0_04195 [Agathobacter sp.]